MTRKYNFIYSKLVPDNNDLVSLVAYALYKRNKIEYIESYKAEHDGRDPQEEDFENFALSSCSPSSLESYRSQAEFLLQKMTLTAAQEEMTVFENKMLKNYRAEIDSAVQKHSPKLWQSVLASVIGAVVFSLAVALGSFLGKTSERSNVELITNAVNNIIRSQHSEQVVHPDTIVIEDKQ